MATQRDWCVKRLDDNGNQFVVRAGLSRAEAERLALDYQAHGHKQSYWACRQQK
ncbi:hypothetical protein AAFN46_19565 [Pseudomonas sp. CAU 1711]|uniref:hypothetical protein n=1 Tax=Pseudomonas sp. CAU 1711 TaxID=3140356 RepID=UPI00325FF3EE